MSKFVSANSTDPASLFVSVPNTTVEFETDLHNINRVNKCYSSYCRSSSHANLLQESWLNSGSCEHWLSLVEIHTHDYYCTML